MKKTTMTILVSILLTTSGWADFSFGNMFKEMKKASVHTVETTEKRTEPKKEELQETNKSVEEPNVKAVSVSKDTNDTNRTQIEENLKKDINSSLTTGYKLITIEAYEEYLKLKAYAKEHNISF